MNNKDLIENYQQQLAELQNKFWFENLNGTEFCVKYDAIRKRINELENETNGHSIWQKVTIFARQQKEKFSQIVTRCRASWGGSQNIHNKRF